MKEIFGIPVNVIIDNSEIDEMLSKNKEGGDKEPKESSDRSSDDQQ